jgi:outer membrane protein OmpA-like peptidoglycan-associated protein
VLFDFGQDALRPAALPTLRRIATDLTSRIPNANVQVDGHTDAIGEDAANLELSTRRADAVKQWMSTEGGVAQARISTRGYGESAPIAPNATAAGADNPAGPAQNRRVVISAGGS